MLGLLATRHRAGGIGTTAPCPCSAYAQVLGLLARRLRRRSRNEHVAGFLPGLETALAGQAEPA